MTLTISMLQFGKSFGVRSEAKKIVDLLARQHPLASYELIVVDFTNVDLISSGFAFDLFRGLRTEIGQDFLRKIRVRFGENGEPIIRSIVRGAFNAEVEQETEKSK